MQFNKNILVYFAMITASDYYEDGTKLSQAGSKTAANKKKRKIISGSVRGSMEVPALAVNKGPL